jgi:hypothetical protein
MQDDLQVLGTLIGWAGINTDFLSIKLPPEDESVYLTDADNVIIKNGRIKKLRGTDYLNSVSTQLGEATKRNVLGIPIYRKYDGTKALMAVTPSKLYQLVSDETWTERSDTDIGGTDDSILSYANADEKFYFVLDESGIIYEWDGATFQAVTFTTDPAITLKAKFLLEYKTFLILLNTNEDATAYYQRFWASNAGTITTFSVGDKLDLEVEGVINGGKKLENSIIVYFDNGIYRVEWQEAYGWTHEAVVDGLGLYCPKTLTGTKDVHYFISQEGLMEYRKGDIPRSISDTKFDKIILEGIDPTYYYGATAQYFPHLHQLFLSYPKSGSTYNDTQVIYDTSARELVSKKALLGENYSIYGAFEKNLSGLSADERKNYGFSFVPLIGSKDGYIKEQKIISYQDGASNYVSKTTHPPTFWKDKVRNKRIQAIDLLIEKYTDEDITFVINLANEANENYEYSYSITGDGNTGIRRYTIRTDDNGARIDCRGKEFVPQIKDSNNPYGWELHAMIFRGYYSTDK